MEDYSREGRRRMGDLFCTGFGNLYNSPLLLHAKCLTQKPFLLVYKGEGKYKCPVCGLEVDELQDN